MAYLFIDTTYDITVGLLNDKFSWLAFDRHVGQKTSSVLQVEVHKTCASAGLKLKELNAIVSVAGPGFYTGLRLSEGFADIFKFFNIPSFSFYSYDIPKLCGFSAGTWLTKAYRGEYFFHHWSDGEKNELIQVSDLDSYLLRAGDKFIHSETALDERALGNLNTYITTSQLLKDRPEEIFRPVIREGFHRESFYFRAPEDEFRMNP